MNRRRSKRLLAISVTAVAALALVGCSTPDAQTTGDPDAPVTLRISFQAAAVKSPYAVMAEAYAEEHSNVTFELEEVPNETYGEVLRTQLQGGNAPDLFYVTGGSGNAQSVIPLAEAGYLVPMTDTVAAEVISESNRVLTDFDGDIYAQPVDFVPITNNYNLTVAEDLGIELPFTSLDDVIDACGVAADAGKSLLILAGAAVPNNGLTTLQMAASRVYLDQPDWNELRADGEVTFADTEGWRESLETIVELRDSGCFQNGVEAGAIADNVPTVAAGNAVGSFAPGGATGDLLRLNPDNEYVATAFPGDSAEDTKIFASASNLIAINASSSADKQAASLAFLAWMAEPEHANETAALSGNISTRAGDGEELAPQFRLIQSYFTDDNYQPLPSLLWPTPEVYNTLGTGVQGLLTGQTTIDNVLAAMDAAWDAAG